MLRTASIGLTILDHDSISVRVELGLIYRDVWITAGAREVLPAALSNLELVVDLVDHCVGMTRSLYS